MNRRILLFLLIIPVLGLFFWARQAASWRPKIITKQQFAARRAPAAAFVDWQEHRNLTPAQQKIELRLLGKNWQALVLSPDGKQMLAQDLLTENFALLNVKDASRLHLLQPRKNSFQGEWLSGQFSSDGRYVEFACFESTPPHVFDARTGQLLWSADYWNAKFAFSPDGKLAAHTNANEDFIIVRQTATGREVKRFPYVYNDSALYFSRDSNFLLAEVAPGQYRQMRLR